jgi:GNAT superfamily N-acetyltransferase
MSSTCPALPAVRNEEEIVPLFPPGIVAGPTIALVELIDVDPSEPRLIADVLPVLLELRPHLTPESFAAIYAEGYPQGLRFTAAYDGGRCVGVAGWRVIATTFAVRKLHVDDLITTEAARSKGVGKALLTDLARRAAEAGCTAIDLDSGVHRFDAHRFYHREGLTISAHHFLRPLDQAK